MQEKNILEVIEELGAVINKYKNDIKYKDIEIECLRKKVESIESYINYYSDNEENKVVSNRKENE